MVDALTPLFDEYASLTGGEGTVRANEPTDIGCTEGERAQHQIVFSIPGSGDVTIDDAEAVFDNFMTGPHDLDVRDDVDFSGETLTSRYEDGAAFYELVKIVRDGYTMTLLVDVGPAEAGGLTVAVDVFTDCLG
ncbi:hypothetical protein CLV30_103334 [Haloactinopolyspora alba]|uniref:Uncharacterized protein n=2 Tax=Haloactinopolyspora alba TaxID=648780 RepID=A0A2P8E9M8_9ACTN|nr:hypothetical protein CLV30_103334 [Haloactinopolyspora alba]